MQAGAACVATDDRSEGLPPGQCGEDNDAGDTNADHCAAAAVPGSAGEPCLAPLELLIGKRVWAGAQASSSPSPSGTQSGSGAGSWALEPMLDAAARLRSGAPPDLASFRALLVSSVWHQCGRKHAKDGHPQLQLACQVDMLGPHA